MTTTRRGLVLGGVTAILFACSGTLREDELTCEEAVSHLIECCPSFDPGYTSCEYHHGSCGDDPPDISIKQAKCIRGLDCSELASQCPTSGRPSVICQ